VLLWRSEFQLNWLLLPSTILSCLPMSLKGQRRSEDYLGAYCATLRYFQNNQQYSTSPKVKKRHPSNRLQRRCVSNHWARPLHRFPRRSQRQSCVPSARFCMEGPGCPRFAFSLSIGLPFAIGNARLHLTHSDSFSPRSIFAR
jgi:hypothetical protein